MQSQRENHEGQNDQFHHIDRKTEEEQASTRQSIGDSQDSGAEVVQPLNSTRQSLHVNEGHPPSLDHSFHPAGVGQAQKLHQVEHESASETVFGFQTGQVTQLAPAFQFGQTQQAGHTFDDSPSWQSTHGIKPFQKFYGSEPQPSPDEPRAPAQADHQTRQFNLLPITSLLNDDPQPSQNEQSLLQQSSHHPERPVTPLVSLHAEDFGNSSRLPGFQQDLDHEMEQTQEPPQTAQEESLGVASQSAQGSSSNLIPQLEEFHLPRDHETGFQNDIIHQSPSIVPNEEKEDEYHSVEHHHGGNGSNSPLSADSADSDQTDPAHYFTQTHPDYEEPGIDTSHHEDKVQEPALPEHTYTSPQPESSSAQSSSGTSIPDDGYYPTSLHVDSEMSDSDSALGSEMGDSTMSMNSSLFESIIENGRTYHKYKEGQYYLPNDEVEQERLNLQHHLWTLTLDGRLHLAPVQNPHRVMDVGTGTGSWALEYAERNPATVVIGTDLSAIQPEYVPPNCQFEIDDAEDEWMFSQKFDFIHGRMLFTCFQNPAQVFIQAYKSLSPGGYFEIQDALFTMESIDGTGDGTAVQQWNAKICDGARKIGRDWHCTRNYAQFMRDAGFENVMERKFKWPTNTWPKGKKAKTLGMWSLANNLDGLSAVSMAILSRAQGMSREEVEVGMVDVRRDLRDKNIHGYIPVFVVYGRKPLHADDAE